MKPNREDVIKSLRICTDGSIMGCKGCAYGHTHSGCCVDCLMQDVLAVLEVDEKEWLQSLNYKKQDYPKGDNSNYKLGDYMKPILIEVNNS